MGDSHQAIHLSLHRFNGRENSRYGCVAQNVLFEDARKNQSVDRASKFDQRPSHMLTTLSVATMRFRPSLYLCPYIFIEVETRLQP
jgi:hypothetical protein